MIVDTKIKILKSNSMHICYKSDFLNDGGVLPRIPHHKMHFMHSFRLLWFVFDLVSDSNAFDSLLVIGDNH